jgi:hypothetical protein
LDTISLLIKIPPREIAYLSFVLESYEGVAAMRTVDPGRGIVEVMVPPSYEEELGEILADLAQEFPVHRIVNEERVQGHDPEKEFLTPSQ